MKMNNLIIMIIVIKKIGFKKPIHSVAVTISVLLVLLFTVILIGLIMCCQDRFRRGAAEMLAHFRMLTVMALCDPPAPPEETGDKVEMIPVCFNASIYSGMMAALSSINSLPLWGEEIG